MSKNERPRITRILLIISAALAVILLACRLTLPYIAKNIIEGKLNKRLGVQATIGNLNLSLLKGSVTLREITINNPSGFDSDPCLSIQKVYVDVSLFSLLSKKIQIELIDIQHFILRIQRNKDGRFNFKSILEHVKSTSTHSSREPTGVQFKKGLFLGLFKAEDVQISFTDHVVSEPPLLTELKDISISLKSFCYPGNSLETNSEILVSGQLMATKTCPLLIHSTFHLGKNPPRTITSNTQETLEDVYLLHFNPYVSRYGYIFKSGVASLTYNGKTANGKIDGLASLRFSNVRFDNADLRLSSLIFGVPLQSLPQLFQYPKGSLELTLEVRGNITNPRISWNKLSEQLLIKALGNTFKSGIILLRKPFDLIIESVTRKEKDGAIFHKLKDVLNPQTSPKEAKKEFQKTKQLEILKDFFNTKLMNRSKKPKKKEDDQRKEK
ncbi:MAG TPA: AsmA family protein [Candidatus Wunengus sp. YC60]|uniref:AsmA family protein n=1 Tax=Candidatus Wunengus sp. YC60 TaxID=3367697 RepID=UPI0040265C39